MHEFTMFLDAFISVVFQFADEEGDVSITMYDACGAAVSSCVDDHIGAYERLLAYEVLGADCSDEDQKEINILADLALYDQAVLDGLLDNPDPVVE